MNNIIKLAEFRKSKGISQRELAELLQTTQQQVSKYEKGVQEMPVRHLITIADTYNTSIDYLVGRDTKTKDVLSNDTLKLISDWQQLTERNKGKIDLLMEQLLEEQSDAKGVV